MKSQTDRIALGTHARLQIRSPRRRNQNILNGALRTPVDALHTIRILSPFHRNEESYPLALDHRFPPIV
nr:MAG TPA: hypothetical protein [Caudoviricetes sp.]